MMSAFRVVLVACFLVTTMGLPKHNITVTVPDGFSNHGNDDLFCLPATWYQVVIFFVINYGSHAVTIRSRPGQTYYHAARDIMHALICPFSGVRRAIDSFGRSSWPSENNFIKAARAGALCIVVRNNEWQAARDSHIADKPSNQLAGATSIRGDRNGNSLQAQFDEMKDRNSADQIEVYEDAQREKIAEETDASPPGLSMDPKVTPVNTTSEGHDSSSKTTLLPAEAHRSYRHIHGMCKLPRGYSLTGLPSNAKVVSDVGDEPGNTELCSSYNVPKAIIAIVQTIYASITLYHARGDQIQRYGYAAFGLTVLPYLMMSIMNLFATSLVPDYSSLYIVRSLELDEAITAGAQVDGAVGRIVQSAIENDRFLTLNKKQDENIDPKEAFLSITHVHSKREVSCYPPIPFEKAGAERWNPVRKSMSASLVLCVFRAIPIAIIGVWTRFDAGKSTKAQRVWTMFWLVLNISCGPWLDIHSERDESPYFRNLMESNVYRWSSTALGTISAIGGFVVVAQMLRAYGTCVEVSGVDF